MKNSYLNNKDMYYLKYAYGEELWQGGGVLCKNMTREKRSMYKQKDENKE